MLACVTSLAGNLLYLAPVLGMIGFVLYAKLRGPKDEDGEKAGTLPEWSSEPQPRI
ncbi:MAG TPA: hypothetical protein VNS09_27685 [Solirubrobacter sp.]|nr:hypothetical protein [Solirubrobacter sp.]